MARREGRHTLNMAFGDVENILDQLHEIQLGSDFYDEDFLLRTRTKCP